MKLNLFYRQKLDPPAPQIAYVLHNFFWMAFLALFGRKKITSRFEKEHIHVHCRPFKTHFPEEYNYHKSSEKRYFSLYSEVEHAE